VNTTRRISAALASAAIVFTAATVCAQADERPALVMTSGSSNLSVVQPRIKGELYTVVPAFAQAAGLHGRALVQVDLDAAGHVVNATVARSTGIALLDHAAIETARMGSYEPERIAGVPVADSFTIIVDFPSDT
jgi:TonB family protein